MNSRAVLNRTSASVPLPPRGILEVVFRPEGSNKLFMATASGLVQVPALLLERLPSVAVSYEDLVEKAVAAAMGAKGDHIPAAVQRAVLARSGGRCEARGCRRRAEQFHHVIPRAEGGSHHPDNIRHVCGSDHEAAHADLLEDTPAGLVRRVDGSGGPQNEADRAYHAIRRGIEKGRGGDPMPTG